MRALKGLSELLSSMVSRMSFSDPFIRKEATTRIGSDAEVECFGGFVISDVVGEGALGSRGEFWGSWFFDDAKGTCHGCCLLLIDKGWRGCLHIRYRGFRGFRGFLEKGEGG